MISFLLVVMMEWLPFGSSLPVVQLKILDFCFVPLARLYCQPASLSVSCSSMQWKGSNLMLGNFTVQQSSDGCNVTSYGYGGFVNGTKITTLSNSLQPRCPDVLQGHNSFHHSYHHQPWLA